MPKCTDCKWFLGWLKNTKYGLCGAFVNGTEMDADVIDKGSAEDDNLRCDLYVEHNVSNNATKKP